MGITKTQIQGITILFFTHLRHEGAEVNFQGSKSSLSNSNMIGINHKTLKGDYSERANTHLDV